jgi:HD-GYP domain-containing protein (c-di-GMP phosphodiesterase class II)
MLGHSRQVAALSERAADALGFEPEATADLRRAALPHALGRVAVSNRIWEKPAALSTTEWERVRLHPYQSERILVRSRVLEPLAQTAGCTTSGRTAPATTGAPRACSCARRPGSWPPPTPSRP